MDRYEDYSDGLTNYLIRVCYKDDKPVKYILLDYCCANARYLAEQLIKLQCVVSYINENLNGYGASDFAEDYLRDTFNITVYSDFCSYR